MLLLAQELLTWEWIGTLLGLGFGFGLLVGYYVGVRLGWNPAAGEIESGHPDLDEYRLGPRKPTQHNQIEREIARRENLRRDRQAQ